MLLHARIRSDVRRLRGLGSVLHGISTGTAVWLAIASITRGLCSQYDFCCGAWLQVDILLEANIVDASRSVKRVNWNFCRALSAKIQIYNSVHAFSSLSLDDLVLWKPRVEVHDVGSQSFSLEGAFNPSAKVWADIGLHHDLHIGNIRAIPTR